MRHVVVPTSDGYLSTADIERAREAIAAIDFFGTAFGTADEDQATLHAKVITILLEEVHGRRDEPIRT
jgi:hypothetical protein